MVEDKEDPVVSSLQALFDVVVEEAETGPIIVFIQVCVKSRCFAWQRVCHA